MACRAYRLVVILALFCYAAAEDCKGRDTMKQTPEARLQSDLLCGYDDDLRPVKDHRQAVNVTVRLSLKYISFNEKEESLSVHSWVGLRWRDEYLNWDPQNYDGLKETQLHSYRIWLPDLSLYNADASVYQSSFYTTCLVNFTGDVTCVPHVVHTAVCSSKLRDWPYDVQNCTMRFGSWMHSGEQLNFRQAKPGAVTQSDYLGGADWKLIDVKWDRTDGVYQCCPNETYPSLRYHFVLRRLAAGHAAIIVVPSVVVMILTLATMLLDVRENTRLGLACFTLFGHFIFLTTISYELPKHSEDTPTILLFLRDSMIMNLVGILLTLLLTNLRQRTEPVPLLLSKLNGLFSGPVKFAVFTEFDPVLLSKTVGEMGEAGEASACEAREANVREWTSVCNVLNSLSFVAILLVYAVLLLVYMPRYT